MREINIGRKPVQLRGGPLAQLYYRQEFGVDLLADVQKMQDPDKDPTSVDGVLLLQLAWCMAKGAEEYGKPFPSFPKWLAQFEYIDWADEEMVSGIMNEVTDSFFRSALPR